MLMNHLEMVVWAQVYAQRCDVSGCYERAHQWDKSHDRPAGMHFQDVVDNRWRYEEAAVTSDACEAADAAVLRLRQHIISNTLFPRTPHILDMSKYLLKYDDGRVTHDMSLDFDSDVDDEQK